MSRLSWREVSVTFQLSQRHLGAAYPRLVHLHKLAKDGVDRPTLQATVLLAKPSATHASASEVKRR